jgi:GT2 family glycosyltransferase
MYAVIIPSKNAANLIPCLTALRKHEPDCPIVVVDDGIGQQGIDAARFAGRVLIAAGSQPFVFARNVNLGIRYATTHWERPWPDESFDGYVLLNDDALLESPGGFTLLERTCAEHPEIAVLGATTNLTGQPLQQRIEGGGIYGAGIRGRLLDGLRFVPHMAFVCCYIPRRTINILAEYTDSEFQSHGGPKYHGSKYYSGGLLDERYVGYGCDDADYCEQVTRAGLLVAVHDGCFVDHASLKSSFRGDPTHGGDFSSNYRLLMQKWGRLITQPDCLPPMSAEDAAKRARNAEILGGAR